MGLYPDAPGAPSYAAGLMDFSPLGNLAQDFYKGADQRLAYQKARAFPDGIPRKPDGSLDYNTYLDVMAQHGDTSQLVPVSNVDLDRQLITTAMREGFGDSGGGPQIGGLPQPQPAQPQVGTPPGARPQASRVTTPIPEGGPPQPVSVSPTGFPRVESKRSIPGGDDGATSVMSIIASKVGDEKAGPIALEVGKLLKLDPNASNTPERAANLTKWIDGHLARNGMAPQQQSVGAAPAAGPVAASAAPAPSAPAAQPAISGGADPLAGILPPGVTRENAGAYLAQLRRRAGALALSPRTAAMAKQYEDQAKVIETALQPTGEQKNAFASGAGSPLDYTNRVAEGHVAAQNKSLVPEQKLYAQAVDQGFKGTELDFETTRARMKGDHFKVIAEDPISGVKQYGFVDPIDKKVYDINGRPFGAGGSGTGSSYLAKGVTAVDQELIGDDYLKQYSPELQAAVKNFIDGKSTPTGNPRKGYAETVKRVAQKYGSDMGLDVSDQAYSERKKFRDQLAMGSPATLGGQRNAANTAIEHLSEAAELATELHNSNWYISALSRGVNWARGLTTEQQAKVNAYHDAVSRYGAEITKYYAGSTGGVEERKSSETRLSGYKPSIELAKAMEAERNLLFGKVRAMELQRDETMRGTGPDINILLKNGKEALAKLDQNIARLKGEKAAGASPTAAPKFNSPADVQKAIDAGTLKKGDTFTDPNGVRRVVP